ncbi:MAG: LptE family protein [Candidatus Binatia bacterium]
MKAKGKRTSASSPRPELGTKAVEPQKAKSKNPDPELRTQTPNPNPQNYIVVLGVLLFLVGTGCGYHFSGRGEGFPKDVKTVYVASFVNTSRDIGIEREIATALRSEFRRQGQLRVVNQVDQADAILSGVVRSLNSRVVTVNRSDEVLQYEITLVTDLSLRRRAPEEVIWQTKMSRHTMLYSGSRGAVVTTSSEFKTGTLKTRDVGRFTDVQLTETLSNEAKEKLIVRYARELHQRLMEMF